MSTTFGEVCQFCNDACGPLVDKRPHACHRVNRRLSGLVEPESRLLSPGLVDDALSSEVELLHAETMKKAVLTRLNAERYSYPHWFSPPRPDMNDTETKQARRRRQMASDFEALHVEETA